MAHLSAEIVRLRGVPINRAAGEVAAAIGPKGSPSTPEICDRAMKRKYSPLCCFAPSTSRVSSSGAASTGFQNLQLGGKHWRAISSSTREGKKWSHERSRYYCLARRLIDRSV